MKTRTPRGKTRKHLFTFYLPRQNIPTKRHDSALSSTFTYHLSSSSPKCTAPSLQGSWLTDVRKMPLFRNLAISERDLTLNISHRWRSQENCIKSSAWRLAQLLKAFMRTGTWCPVSSSLGTSSKCQISFPFYWKARAEVENQEASFDFLFPKIFFQMY